MDNNGNIPEFIDLLFEKRNKEYGAYYLRKRYNRVLAAGILISTIIGSASIIIPSIGKGSKDKIISGGGNFVQYEMENLPPPEEYVYVPPPPPPPEETSTEEILKYVPPVVVDSIPITEQKLITTDEALTQTTDSETSVYGNGFGEEIFTGEGSGGDGEEFFLVEVMPTFKGGGLDEFRKWVNRRTNYPQEAIDAKIRGTVFLTFVVEKDGSVSNVTVLKGVHPLLDNEAIKAISESPKWSPGLQRGQPVRVRYQIPLSFLL